jgi:hypothetical protein
MQSTHAASLSPSSLTGVASLNRLGLGKAA